MSCAGHWTVNSSYMHAFPDVAHRHAGDLGNIFGVLDSNERYYYRVYTETDLLFVNFASIFGRGFIIHANPDCGGDAVGKAGARSFAGVVGFTETALTRASFGITDAMVYGSFGGNTCDPPAPGDDTGAANAVAPALGAVAVAATLLAVAARAQ